jgi:hypothetical protein
MLDGKPSKVQCKTCRGEHRYKTSGSPAPARKTGTRTTVPKTVIRAAELWEQKMSQKHKEDAHPYQANRKFAAGDVVQHPSFGFGIVEEIRSPTKISVLFRDGEKLLVHAIGVS